MAKTEQLLQEIKDLLKQTDSMRGSEMRYRRLFQTARDGILILDADTGRIIDANPFMTELLGYSHTAFLGKELWEIGLFQDREASQAAFRQLKAVGYIRYENLPLETRNGEQRDVEMISNVYREGDTEVIQCNIRDITERRRMELELAAAYERERRIAAALQRSQLFVPPEDAFPGLAVSTLYETAVEDALVGGDFWDTLAFDDGQVALVVGDVMGKGLHAAIFTSELRYVLRAFLREHLHPARVLTQMNAYLCETNRLHGEGLSEEDDGDPVCLALAVLSTSTGIGSMSSAGMEPLLFIRADRQMEELKTHALPLGIFPNAQYATVTFQMNPGDYLLLTSDGITEARRGKEFFGYEGLMRLAQQGLSAGTLEQMGKTILEGARAFAGGTLHDDACLVLARRL